MDELIDRIAAAAGIDAETARRAVTIILQFLHAEAPTDKVEALLAKIDGAGAAVAGGADGDGLSGGLGGLLGGGVMGALGKLQGLGLGMGEIQSVTRETVGYAREKAGNDLVEEVVGAIPGLRQFI